MINTGKEYQKYVLYLFKYLLKIIIYLPIVLLCLFHYNSLVLCVLGSETYVCFSGLTIITSLIFEVLIW